VGGVVVRDGERRGGGDDATEMSEASVPVVWLEEEYVCRCFNYRSLSDMLLLLRVCVGLVGLFRSIHRSEDIYLSIARPSARKLKSKEHRKVPHNDATSISSNQRDPLEPHSSPMDICPSHIH